MVVKMCWERLSDGEILDDGVVGIGSVLERVLALIELYPGIPANLLRVFFEDEEVVLFRNEVVGVVILRNLPVFPVFERRSRAHRAHIGLFSSLIGCFHLWSAEGKHIYFLIQSFNAIILAVRTPIPPTIATIA